MTPGITITGITHILITAGVMTITCIRIPVPMLLATGTAVHPHPPKTPE